MTKRFTLSEVGCYRTSLIVDDGRKIGNKEVVECLNALHEENEQLKSEYKVLHTQYQDLKKFVKNNFDEYLTQEKLNRQIIKLSEENEQLKQELWDISIDYFTETYSDNSIRRDEHINEFKKEFKAKYGDVE